MRSPTLAKLFPDISKLADAPQDPSLDEFQSHLVAIAHARWPTSSLEIAEFLGHSIQTRDEKRLLSSRIAYHVKKLVDQRKLMSKRVGNALIVWPYDVESLRIERSSHSPPKPKPGGK